MSLRDLVHHARLVLYAGEIPKAHVAHVGGPSRDKLNPVVPEILAQSADKLIQHGHDVTMLGSHLEKR